MIFIPPRPKRKKEEEFVIRQAWEAREWFLRHRSGEVKVINALGLSKYCKDYFEALDHLAVIPS